MLFSPRRWKMQQFWPYDLYLGAWLILFKKLLAKIFWTVSARVYTFYMNISWGKAFQWVPTFFRIIWKKMMRHRNILQDQQNNDYLEYGNLIVCGIQWTYSYNCVLKPYSNNCITNGLYIYIVSHLKYSTICSKHIIVSHILYEIFRISLNKLYRWDKVKFFPILLKFYK